MTQERAIVVASSREILSRHARSFRWAATFLPADRHDDAAVLYAFCRVVDDAVDEAPNEDQARAAVAELERQLNDPRPSHPLIAELCRMAKARRVPLRAAEQLIEGVAGDLDEVRVADDAELIRYCYHAAGTVGLMMCGVLGVEAIEARAHAIDLGIAMQLTNICRDVREDAAMGRVYLPASRLRAVGVDPDDLVRGRADREAVARVVVDLLELAERYYASADAGMRYIPARPRLAILVASRVYRAIGRRLLHRHAADALHGRTVVPAGSKLVLVVAAVLTWM
ncbi:MAG: phytoene/squalene synthase family protein, partial [Polyangiaceae bacterium]